MVLALIDILYMYKEPMPLFPHRCLAVWRFDVDAGKAFLNSIEAPYILRFVIALFRRRIVGASRVQGLGRHSHEEVMEMGRKDLKALSLCLGECQGLGSFS